MMRRFTQLFGGGYSPLPEADEAGESRHGQRGAQGATDTASKTDTASAGAVRRRARTEGAFGIAPASEDRPELASPVAFYDLARRSQLRAMAWAPFTTEEAQYMLDNLCDAAETGLHPDVKPAEWRRFLVLQADHIDEMDEHWQSLPGLRERHAAQFDATLAQPLAGPLDHYLQMQVGMAEANFARARDAFFDGKFDRAQAFDRQGLLFCERARDTWLCHRHGTEQEQLALMGVIDAAKAKREPPEAEQALVDAAGWRSRGTLPDWPPADDTASPAGAASAITHDAPAPDFWQRLADASVILRKEGVQIDPSGQLGQLMYLLIQESQQASVSRPEFAAVLEELHQQIGAARRACETLHAAGHALAAWTQVLQRHPHWRGPAAALESTARARVEEARRSLAEGQHREAATLADQGSRTLRHLARVIQQAEAGQWPQAEVQLRRRSELAARCLQLQAGRSSPSSLRQLQRADALLQALDGVETAEQATTLLDHLKEALSTAELTVRQAGDARRFWQVPKALHRS